VGSPDDPAGIRGILLDVEGTTTPVAFVYEALFPYARAGVRPFLESHGDDEGVRADLARLREEHAADDQQDLGSPSWRDEPGPAALDAAAAYVHWLMDRDRKSTGLKSLQGRIWEAGFRSGALKGQVYDDVPRAFERWQRQGRRIAIFSSGSVLSQRLLFAHTPGGDLTRFLQGHFDTSTGAKRDAESYRRIAGALGLPPSQVLFLSDVTAELDAARAGGVGTALCVRGHETVAGTAHRVVRSFDEVFP
jgi:enolase-phosphatase E1